MPSKKTEYSGFGLRFIAYSIDAIILFILNWLIGIILVYTNLSLFMLIIAQWGLLLGASAIYEILLTYKYGGTLGKILMKIKVVDEKGNFISFWRSTGRHFAKYISSIILYIGFLMVLWDGNKQGLHDKMARTYVVDNKIQINRTIRRLIVILTILIIVGYLTYIISLAIFGFSLGIKLTSSELNPEDPLGSLYEKCDYKFPQKREICMLLYFQRDAHIQDLDISSKLQFCSKLKSKSSRAACISHIASMEQDESICSNIESNFYQRICKRQINLISSFSSFTSFSEIDRSSWGKLKGGEIIAGREIGISCIPNKENLFYPDDVACFDIRDVSGFEQGADDNYVYNLDIKVWSDGKLVDSAQRILGDDLTPLEEGIMGEEVDVYSTLKSYGPGKYIYEFILYDEISRKVTIINKTITITDESPGYLEVEKVYLGLHDESTDECLHKEEGDNVFSKEGFICMEPIISGFEPTPASDGLYWFDMDLNISSIDGNLITYNQRLWGSDGKSYLEDGVLEGHYIFEPLEDYETGSYILELTIYDQVSRKKVRLQKEFHVTD